MPNSLFVILFSILMTGGVWAQSPYTAAEQFNREGRYVKITLLSGNPVKIFVSGKERARFDTTNFKMEFRPHASGDWQELKINDYGEYYAAETPVDLGLPKTLEVKTTIKNKNSETFKFKLR